MDDARNYLSDKATGGETPDEPVKAKAEPEAGNEASPAREEAKASAGPDSADGEEGEDSESGPDQTEEIQAEAEAEPAETVISRDEA